MSCVYVVNGVCKNGQRKLLRVCISEELAEMVAADKRAKVPNPFAQVTVDRWHLYGTDIETRKTK